MGLSSRLDCCWVDQCEVKIVDSDHYDEKKGYSSLNHDLSHLHKLHAILLLVEQNQRKHQDRAKSKTCQSQWRKGVSFKTT